MMEKDTSRTDLEVTTELVEMEESISTSEEIISSKVVKRRPFRVKRLGERLFLLGMVVSLVMIGGFYIQITQLAFHYDEIVKEEQTMGHKEETTDSVWIDDVEQLTTDPSLESTDLLDPDATQSWVATITYNGLNVRVSPDSNAEKIGVLYLNDQVPVLENDEASAFIQIDFHGTPAYVHRDYVDLNLAEQMIGAVVDEDLKS